MVRRQRWERQRPDGSQSRIVAPVEGLLPPTILLSAATAACHTPGSSSAVLGGEGVELVNQTLRWADVELTGVVVELVGRWRASADPHHYQDRRQGWRQLWNFSTRITLLPRCCNARSPRGRVRMNKALTILPAATGIVSNEHGEDGRMPTRIAADPYSARLALDHVEWLDRLARLAELRESGQLVREAAVRGLPQHLIESAFEEFHSLFGLQGRRP